MSWFGRSPETGSAPPPDSTEADDEQPTSEEAPQVDDQPPREREDKEIQPTGEYSGVDYQDAAERVRVRQSEESERRIDQHQLGRLTQLEKIVAEKREASPEEIIDIIHEFDFHEVKKIESERKHGTGFIASIKKFLDSDSIFNISEVEKTDAETGELTKSYEFRYRAWQDLLARGTKAVFNRRTAISVAATAAVGVITGGTSLAAGAVVAGGWLGRMSAESIDLLKGDDAVKGGTRGARKEILIAESEKWLEMQQLARDYQDLRESNPVQANDILDKITQLYYNQGEAAVMQRINTAEKSLEVREKKLNKLRGALGTVGELVGVGAYAAVENMAGSFDPVDLDLLDKVPGQSVFHGVQQAGDTYNFLWTNADKAMGFGSNAISHFLGKTVDSTTSLVVATIAERGLPVVLASSLLGGWSYRNSEARTSEDNETQKESTKIAFTGINEQVPRTLEYLKSVAKERGVHIPQNPEGYKYDWEKQPHTIPKKEFSFEKIPTWVLDEVIDPATGEIREGMAVDPASATFIEVAVAAVNPEMNQIAIVKYEKEPNTGASAYPVETMHLDDFMRKYRPIIRQEAGRPYAPAAAILGSTPNPTSPEPESISPDSNDALEPDAPATPDEPANPDEEGDSNITPPPPQPGNPPRSTGTAKKRPQLEQDERATRNVHEWQQNILHYEGDELRKNRKTKSEVENRDDDRHVIVDALNENMPHVKKELLKEAGIQVIKTVVHIDHLDPSKDHEELRIILHKDNGEKGVLTISLLGGVPNIPKSEFTHMYPDDQSEKKLRHFKDPNLEVLDAFSSDLVDRLDAAAKKLEKGGDEKSQQAVEQIEEAVQEAEEGNSQPEPEAKVVEEKPAETLPEGFGIGSIFHFSEEFRNDPNTVKYRHDLANIFFPDIDENDRLRKLMGTDLVVTHLEPLEDNMYHVSYAAKKNGGQTEEEESLFLTPQEIGKLLKI